MRRGGQSQGLSPITVVLFISLRFVGERTITTEVCVWSNQWLAFLPLM